MQKQVTLTPSGTAYRVRLISPVTIMGMHFTMCWNNVKSDYRTCNWLAHRWARLNECGIEEVRYEN